MSEFFSPGSTYCRRRGRDSPQKSHTHTKKKRYKEITASKLLKMRCDEMKLHRNCTHSLYSFSQTFMGLWKQFWVNNGYPSVECTIILFFTRVTRFLQEMIRFSLFPQANLASGGHKSSSVYCKLYQAVITDIHWEDIPRETSH